MKNRLLVLLVLSAIALPIFAQDDDDEDKKGSWDTPIKTKVGGAGGIVPSIGFFNYNAINSVLKSANVPTLGSDPLYLIGGEGYGYIMFLKNVRMGGRGQAGMQSVSFIDTSNGTRTKKQVDYSISYGGFLIDYVIPVASKLDVAIGFTIGAGEVDIKMIKDDGNFKEWNSLWNEFGNTAVSAKNYTRTLKGSYGSFVPNVSVEYALLKWMQLRIGASYPIMFSAEWKLDDEFEVIGVPSKLKPSGYTVNAGIMFGFFN